MLAARFLQLFAKKIFVVNSFQVVLILFHFLLLTSSALPILRQGSSMSVENPDDVLNSPSGMFSAGFYRIGQNAYCFAIWFSKPYHDGQFIIWTSNNTVRDHSWSQLNLLDSGNLVLQSLVNGTLRQSFDSPTDTLLHEQPLTQHNRLVSARSQSDYSSGNYKLMYDYDNVLRLVLDSPETSSIYWPDSTVLDYLQGRTRFNDSRIAVFDSSGYFTSSDKVEFQSADFGRGPWRRLTLDFDEFMESVDQKVYAAMIQVQAQSDTLRQSFDSPTDTLLHEQPLTQHNRLVSARSQSDYSSGNYKLMYDYDNVLRLVLDSPETSSIYWPDSTVLDYLQGRTRFNDSRIAVFDSSGYFTSSVKVEFQSADFGRGPWRRLTLDFDEFMESVDQKVYAAMIQVQAQSDTLRQSFDSPTDTLLHEQPLTQHNRLVSARSQSDYSSGNYKLMYDYDNVLRLVLDSPETSSIYWPDSTVLDYLQGRTRFNDSRIAVFDSSGYFTSSDKVEFQSADFGRGPWRRLTLDFDGNLRLYSLEEQKGIWSVTWQAMSNSCRIHGICGPKSICSYDPSSGPK
ncbi:hypothetical protein PVK06_015687 [Gossypium arboreum]|uniref:Bulb-type lectin domain-containing protein n=1 Tax=Gossypium arboreum TaxID=29729 RepID=A0ABR0PYP3_GOSAR|nr:hypothetical protein PVK06_015687 [Gossypium arboreum]